MKKKKSSLNEYANEAAAAGVTYGQKQAREYAEKVKIRPVPDGYRKAAEFSRKKWEEDL
ncbi:MAG: hypothetical protein HDR11_09830 [Lachnospiraceae bacterium]|nr:hypothetical protein [Lachnospiraceae bacterium]MBD5536869.1 hypothetical protein [Lachnospiraceae bacterium]